MRDDDSRWGTRLFEGRRSHRRRAGLIVPSSIALAAAVVLTALAFTLGGGGEDLTNSTLPTSGPVIGDVPLNPPGAPLPTVAPPTGTPAPSPSEARKDSGASRGGDAEIADGARLTVDTADVPGTVNLSAEGSRDWVHWGQQNVWSLERRRGGGFAILEGTPGRSRERHESSAQAFAWRGGDPVASTDGVRSGIRSCGRDTGFTLSAPATRGETRTLRLYVGVFEAVGELRATLTGAPAVTATLESAGRRFAVFTVTYRAIRDARVQLSWITRSTTAAGGCHGVALQAATLH